MWHRSVGKGRGEHLDLGRGRETVRVGKGTQGRVVGHREDTKVSVPRGRSGGC